MDERNRGFGESIQRTAQNWIERKVEHQYDFPNLLMIDGDEDKQRKAEIDAFQLYEDAFQAIFLPSKREPFMRTIKQLASVSQNYSSEQLSNLQLSAVPHTLDSATYLHDFVVSFRKMVDLGNEMKLLPEMIEAVRTVEALLDKRVEETVRQVEKEGINENGQNTINKLRSENFITECASDFEFDLNSITRAMQREMEHGTRKPKIPQPRSKDKLDPIFQSSVSRKRDQLRIERENSER